MTEDSGSDEGRDEGRDFCGTPVRMVLEHLRAHTAPGTLDAVLAASGDPRPLPTLLDDTTWSSYAAFRRLMEAAAAALGDPRGLDVVGRAAPVLSGSGAAHIELLQELGSPAALYSSVDQSARSLSVVYDAWSEELGSTAWCVHHRARPGIEPFPEYCGLVTGLLSLTPRLFGYPTADVTETACQCDGAPECSFEVRWIAPSDADQRAEYFEQRSRVLDARLTALHHTVTDLVSASDVDGVLERLVAESARAVPAPAHVLTVERAGERGIFAVGVAEDRAATAARGLWESGPVNEPGRLVVPVESQRGRHGYLAILDPTGGRRFYTRAVRVLESYARLAAAALDSAAAVADARREATTARILLELSSTLAELGGVEEMATRLARAVPDVARCDRAIVALVDPETRRCRVTATCGYPADVEAELRTHTFDPVDPMQQGFRYEAAGEGDGVAQRLMVRTGTVAMASVPIVANGEYAGHVVAAVSRPDPAFRDDPTLADRLRGLAGQAATAVRNGRLLEQVRYQALHDALTGLPNRALILDRVDHMLAHARRQRQPAAALFIDLDGFKDVNDSFGHAAGDRLLQAVAARLATTLRDSDTVGRLGGDEFVALVEGPSLAAGPEVVAERLLAVLREPFEVDLPGIAALSITASIGIAVGDRLSPTEMLRDADIALYRAKGSGKDCYVLFEPEMQTAVRDRVRLETDLRAALAQDQFFLVYQPIFDLRDDTARGAEALLRWRHPTRGVIQPDEFIPTLEDTGLIVEVGRWVLREACRRAATLTQRDRPFEISVNVSARQLDSDAFVGELVDAIASSGIEPTSLTLEITETTIMRDADATARRLAEVKALGVRIAIDDFGTGYSSLAYLRQFPVDALKIDRSFIAALTDSDEADALVHTLVRLGKTLGIETLAEGIEEQSQYDELQQQDCDSGQGFLLAHPLAGDELERFLTSRRDPSITSG